MNNHLTRFKKNKKFVLFDYETCNLNLCSLNNKPWQLAFLICHGDEVVDKFNYLLKWEDINVSPEAAKITGFNLNHYNKHSQCPLKCLENFNKYIYNEDYFIVGHNILSFDIYIHNLHRNLCSLSSDYSYLDRTIDTNCLAKSSALNLPIDHENFFLWQMKVASIRKKGLKTNLKFLCEQNNINFDPSKLHDALYDIEKNLEVFLKMLWKYEF